MPAYLLAYRPSKLSAWVFLLHENARVVLVLCACMAGGLSVGPAASVCLYLFLAMYLSVCLCACVCVCLFVCLGLLACGRVEVCVNLLASPVQTVGHLGKTSTHAYILTFMHTHIHTYIHECLPICAVVSAFVLN